MHLHWGRGKVHVSRQKQPQIDLGARYIYVAVEEFQYGLEESHSDLDDAGERMVPQLLRLESSYCSMLIGYTYVMRKHWKQR